MLDLRDVEVSFSMTDDSQIEAKKASCESSNARDRVPWFAFLGLIFFSVNIFTAIETGTVYAAWPPHVVTVPYHDPSWLTHAMTISHQVGLAGLGRYLGSVAGFIICGLEIGLEYHGPGFPHEFAGAF
jgi:hypothetical protein